MNERVDFLERELYGKVEKQDIFIGDIQKVHIEPSAFAKTFTAFCGADMILLIDGVCLSEMQHISWEKDLTGGRAWPIKGTLTCAMFEDEPLALEDKHYTITVQYRDEYGNCAQETFYEVNFHRMHGGMGVNSIIPEVKYDFTASKREYRSKLTVEELINEREVAKN